MFIIHFFPSKCLNIIHHQKDMEGKFAKTLKGNKLRKIICFNFSLQVKNKKVYINKVKTEQTLKEYNVKT